MVVRPTSQPGPGQRSLVGRVVIHDNVDIEITRHLCIYLLEEVDNLAALCRLCEQHGGLVNFKNRHARR